METLGTEPTSRHKPSGWTQGRLVLVSPWDGESSSGQVGTRLGHQWLAGPSQGLEPGLHKRTPTCSQLLPASFLTQLVFLSQGLPLPHPSRAPSAARGAQPCSVPPWLRAQQWGRASARLPVPPQPVLCPHSHRGRGQGRTVTPATSAAAVSTSWSEPAPRDASSTAAASSAGAAGPPCAWATTPSTRRMVRRFLGTGNARVTTSPPCRLSHESAPLPSRQVIFTARCTTPIRPARSCPGMRLQLCLMG